MIIRRLLSIVVDFLASLIPAYGVHLAGISLLYAFLFFYAFTQICELFFLNGRTAGMVALKVYPQNMQSNKPSIGKLSLYHIALSIVVFNMMNPSYNVLLESVVPILLFFPFFDTQRYNSAMDLLFRIHWVSKAT